LRVLRCFLCVMRRLSLMFDRNPRVMRRPVVIAGVTEVRCLLMMTCRVVVVRRCLTMMLCCVFRHLECLHATLPVFGGAICSKGHTHLEEGKDGKACKDCELARCAQARTPFKLTGLTNLTGLTRA
jgi:hypothetical protein